MKINHIDVRHHFVREKMSNLEIKIIPVETEKMVADNLTKSVFNSKQQFCTRHMGLK